MDAPINKSRFSAETTIFYESNHQEKKFDEVSLRQRYNTDFSIKNMTIYVFSINERFYFKNATRSHKKRYDYDCE